MTEGLDDLRSLASRHGIATDFWDWHGQLRVTSEPALVAILAAMGVDAGSPERVAAALRDHEDDQWRQTIPTVVLRAGHGREIPVHVPHGESVAVRIELDPESGGGRWDVSQLDVYVPPRMVDGHEIGRATFALPPNLPTGWHELVAESAGRAVRRPLIVVPHRIDVDALIGPGRSWGFQAQLYSVRSAASWGLGDLADLADLASASAGLGADFVLINPLHAAEPTVPMTPSPYLPVSRRFTNPIYLRVEDIRETAYLSPADRLAVDRLGATVRPLDTSAGPLDRDAVWTAKKKALELVFAVPRSQARQRAFERFTAERGEALEDFATWSALVEHLGLAPGQPLPAELSGPGAPAVATLRAELADRVTFHRWLQWQVDEQLATAQRVATAGMRIGVIQDLAVGVRADGADAWSLGDAMAHGVTVGAPPDMFNQLGQDWSQPPWSPRGLVAEGYRPFREMLRSVFRHCGAVRIDHILGLFRLWWVPAGHPPDDGAYVYYDHEALVGILCLEAERAGVAVIGEDLGVVEPWVRDYLADRGILGTSVLWFETVDGGHLRPPEQWRPLVLATVTTHDLPPTAGYLDGEHVDLRDRLGLLTEPVEIVRAADERERRIVLDDLAGYGLLEPGATADQQVEALHRFVARTPARLVGVALTDAVGDRRTQNQPGTDTEYPNWRMPLSDGTGRPVLLDDLDRPSVRRVASAAAGE